MGRRPRDIGPGVVLSPVSTGCPRDRAERLLQIEGVSLPTHRKGADRPARIGLLLVLLLQRFFRQRSATTLLIVFKHHFLSNWRNSTGAPFSTIKATVTPGEGELGAISISFPAISAERSSTSKAT